MNGQESAEKFENRSFNLFPGCRARVDQVEMIRGLDLQQVRVFFFFAGMLLFGRDVVAAEFGWDNIVGRAVNQPLAGLWN